MTKTYLSMDLPKVGEQLKRVMTFGVGTPDERYIVEDCTVTHVNEKRRWYEVTFANSGIKECYGLPMFDHSVLIQGSRGGMPVLCIETGAVYSSLRECSRDMRLNSGNISKQLDGEYTHCGGYHFAKVL